MIKVPEELNMLRDVNIPSPTDDYVLTYDAATGLWGAEAAAGGGVGDMTKAVYDTDDDGIVDNSETLEGSTKAQVQDHAPKAHTHVEADVTDLDHNAQKIKSKTVDAPQAADDDKFLQYDHTNSKFVLTAGGGGGASAFTDLSDVPASYVGSGGKAVKVKDDETGLEFGDCPMAVSGSKSLTMPIPSISVIAELV